MQIMKKHCCSSRFFWQAVRDHSACFLCIYYALIHALNLRSAEGLAEDH